MYEMKRRITYSQVKQDLKMDMAEMVHFFQDCVLENSEQIGKGMEEVRRSRTAWFLSGWQIEVERYPEFMEEVTVRTWPHDFKGMFGYRNFQMLDKDRTEVARANSIWVFMDLEKMHPTKPTMEALNGYEMEQALDMEYAPRRIKLLEASCKLEPVDATPLKVKPSYIDSNAHVNNGRYVEEAMNYLPERKEISRMRVEYRKSAVLGDEMYPVVYEKNDIYQVLFEDVTGTPFVIIEVV